MANFLNNIFGAGAQSALLGTSEDEMYRNHINHLRAHEDELMRQKHANTAQNRYTQHLAQSMMNTKQGVVQGIMASQQPINPFNPNELGAYKIPLSQLVTLWQAKYGDEWVRKPDEDFWMDALTRLNVAGEFEHAGGWYRIKENA